MVFTDALTRLSSRLPPYGSRAIYITDWGMQNSLAMLHEGRLNLKNAEGAFRTETPTDGDVASRAEIFANRDEVLLGFLEGWEIVPGIRGRLEAEARKQGLNKETLETIEDSHGRPVFEIFRLKPQ